MTESNSTGIENGRLDDSLAIQNYSVYRKSLTEMPLSPQLVGLSEQDYVDAISNSDVTKLDFESGMGKIEVPILVPANNIFWYNTRLLHDIYGKSTDIDYAPPLPADSIFTEEAIELQMEFIANGGVLIVDANRDDPNPRLDPIVKRYGDKVVVENLGAGQDERYLNQYVSAVSFPGHANEFAKADTFFNVYSDLVSEGKIEAAPMDGVSLVDVIEDDEIDSIWQLYDESFAELGKNHPINAGYDELTFKKILTDPSVVKAINRSEGEITTICLFLTDLSQCTWLDPDYFHDNYEKALETDNLLIFLGIVTDEAKRGLDYATNVIDLVIEVGYHRNSSSVITFECNEISENATPILVDGAIKNSGIAETSGIDKPVSQLSFFAIRSAT
ncbi:MAG: hypothetical protein QG628_160 [Patescibacteria group bacterium]|nr:hypothetical protein [Patescibacteria group bacterium]